MEPIQIHLGDENRIYIEKDVKHSPLFAEQYEQLIRKMAEYISSASKNVDTIEYNSLNENNIFLINGERGSGKTSMLASMREHLKPKKDGECVFGKKFLRLKMIDPSWFTNNSNILQIIIAELFKEFKKATQEKSIGYEEKNEITKLFVQVKHSLCVLDSPSIASNIEDSDIESLTDMSNAMLLEEQIKEIIKSILKAMDKDMLLVCVDDIDLNTSYAYDMLEQVRKYLILPNVIILIAAKNKQLLEVVQQHYLNEFKLLLEKEMMTPHEVVEISTKYLLKLFPLEHRVDLNNAIDKFHQPIEIWKGENKIASASNGDELIYKLIYQKTGLQYLLDSNGTNYIVPTNLRSFRFLVKMLSDMEAEQAVHNIDVYQHYFVSEWMPEHLQIEERKEIEDILMDANLQKVNKKVISSIDEKLNIYEKPSTISMLTDVSNVYANVSLGDVMAMIIWGKNNNSTESFAKYVYAIKHAYTILLEKAYKEMIQEEAVEKKINIYENPEASEYLNNYQQLVGGALLSGYTWDYLLPMFNNTESRLHRSIWVNLPTLPQMPLLLRCLIVAPNRSKMVNEGEAYRKQIPIYYQQPIIRAINRVIIDWFNILYSIPFCIEQLARFGDDNAKQEMLDMLRNDEEDDKTTCKSMFSLGIHSVDLLERIYWHIREKRKYLRMGATKMEIYKRLLNTIKDVSFDSYISDEDKKALYVLIRVADSFLTSDENILSQLLEEVHKRPTRPVGYPETDTVRQCRTAAELKTRMRIINVPKGYSAEWLDHQFDNLGITDEEVQTQDARALRDRLKQIKA